MTEAELLTLINNTITSNGNNEITGDVLRPVLIAMVEQINDLVGNPDNLPSGSSTVIEAINNQVSEGIVIHEGEDNPNTTPPLSYELGDFYNQVNGSSITVAFWQYNGISWIQLIDESDTKIRNIFLASGNHTVSLDTDVLLYTSGVGNTVTMPDATTTISKIFTLVNKTSSNAVITSYINTLGNTSTVFKKESVLRLISTGVNWQQINN